VECSIEQGCSLQDNPSFVLDIPEQQPVVDGTTDTTLTVQTVEDPSELTPPAMAAVMLGPAGTLFAEPVQVCLRVDHEHVVHQKDILGLGLGLQQSGEAAGSWSNLDHLVYSLVDREQGVGMICGSTQRLSTFAARSVSGSTSNTGGGGQLLAPDDSEADTDPLLLVLLLIIAVAAVVAASAICRDKCSSRPKAEGSDTVDIELTSAESTRKLVSTAASDRSNLETIATPNRPAPTSADSGGNPQVVQGDDSQVLVQFEEEQGEFEEEDTQNSSSRPTSPGNTRQHTRANSGQLD
jgi:hypothetical protein